LEHAGVGLLVWSPLAGGFLSGKQPRGGDVPEGSRDPAARPYIDLTRGFDTIDVLRPIAQAHDVSVAQTALAWLLHQKVVSSILVGAKRMDQLEDNLKAIDIIFTSHDLAAIDTVSKLPPEYPGWMIDMWSGVRAKQLAESKR
jgi:aryl-alcohol dehydrogenase-like predicted oxidoreductase